MGVYQDCPMPDIPTTQFIFTCYSVPTGYVEVNKLLIQLRHTYHDFLSAARCCSLLQCTFVHVCLTLVCIII